MTTDPSRTSFRSNLFNVKLARRHLTGSIFGIVALLGALVGVAVLIIMLVEVWRDGIRYFRLEFLDLFHHESQIKQALNRLFGAHFG